jgi:7-cyano-7-deazaguanine synthase
MDSTVLLYQLLADDIAVTALLVDYGQRHDRELTSAEEIATRAGVPYITAQLASALGPVFIHAKSSQVGQLEDVPEGHYEEETMKTTIVPNRNMFLIALAGMLAESIGADGVAYAAHAGDHAIYPDCRPEFVEAAGSALFRATDGKVALYAPFQYFTKASIARIGHDLDAPLNLTYSCYKGADGSHCGVCGTCTERREAFQLAGVFDPTTYAR